MLSLQDCVIILIANSLHGITFQVREKKNLYTEMTLPPTPIPITLVSVLGPNACHLMEGGGA